MFTYVPMLGQEALIAEYSSGVAPGTGTVTNRLPAVRICSDAAALSWLGAGCAGSNGLAPALGFRGNGRLGSHLDLVLSSAPPNGSAMLTFGYDSRPPFPFDLAALGMPDCRQYFDVTATVGIATDALGIASHRVTIPYASALAGQCVYAQALASDGQANAAGATVSNYGRIQVGY